MSSERYTQMMRDKKHVEQQTDAEVAFAELLESRCIDCTTFMKQWKLSHHQFNTLAHYLHGVNDEEPILPPALSVLLGALERRQAA